jgi:hypothetical protein
VSAAHKAQSPGATGLSGSQKTPIEASDLTKAAAFLEVFNRIAAALENQNSSIEGVCNRLEDLSASVSGGLLDVALSRKGGHK